MADTTTATYTFTLPEIGASEDTWGTKLNANWTALDALLDGTTAIAPNLVGWEVGGVAVTSTAAELNLLDGVTATTAELNILDGVTATAAELNILDGVTATAAELNILDGVTATAAELNHTGGVTSAIQTQINAKYTAATQTETVWEAGTSTTDSLASPAKVAAAIAALADSAAGFTQSLGGTGSEGYTIFPNGLIMQWGRTGTLSGDTTVTLPIAFPNAHITGVASPSQSSALTGNVSAYYVVSSLTQCIITHDASGNSDSSPVGWIAIGY